MNCEICGAKWHLNFSRIIYYSNGANARMHVELKKESEDGKGKELLGKNLETPKWKKMLLRTQRVKSICKYCGVIIKEKTDYCKKCGIKIDYLNDYPGP